MIRLGSFEIKTEIFLLILCAFLLSVQLLLCFKSKRLWIRLIPLGLFAAPAAVLVFISLFDEYHRIGLLIYAFYLGVLAFVCVCGWAIWWIIDSFIAFLKGLSKKQTVTLFSVLGSVVLVVATAIGLFHYTYPTSYPYKDREIIGCTPEEIEAKYGEFWALYRNEENVPTAAEYMIREDYTDYLGNDDSLSYYIVFKDGVAVRVRLQKGRPGG